LEEAGIEGEIGKLKKAGEDASEILAKAKGAQHLRTLRTIKEISADPSEKIVIFLPSEAEDMIKHNILAGLPLGKSERGKPMSLKKMKRALVMELGAKSNMNLFQKAKSQYKALADHETAMSVLALLSSESKRHWEEKDNLVRALIKESQTRPHPYWGTLLTIAFYPMLSRLRGRITGNALTRDDFDQLDLRLRGMRKHYKQQDYQAKAITY